MRDCDWQSAPFGKLEALPEKGKPVTHWTPQDRAWRNVAAEIRRVVESRSGEHLDTASDPTPASAARRALNIEISANIRLLQSIWTEVNRPPDLDADARVASGEVLPAIRLMQQDPPKWRRAIFEQRIADYVDSLSAEEMNGVDRFYERLSQFDRLRSRLKPFWSLGHSYNLDSAGKEVWRELTEVAESTLLDGHPLNQANEIAEPIVPISPND